MDAGLQILFTFIGGLGGGALGSFWKKKAENWATKQDVAKLTDITKRVEEKISNEIWDRQKRLELKREVIYAMVHNIAEAQDALLGFQSTLFVTDNALIEKRWRRWMKATTKLEESKILLNVVAEKAIQDAFAQFVRVAHEIASGIDKKDRSIYEARKPDLQERLCSVSLAARSELDVDLKSQSNGS